LFIQVCRPPGRLNFRGILRRAILDFNHLQIFSPQVCNSTVTEHLVSMMFYRVQIAKTYL
jgi:hypothetical protein